MTPVGDEARMKSSRRSIPLFSSPKVRRSIGITKATPIQPAVSLDRSFNAEQTGRELQQQSSLMNDDEEELRERQRQRAAELQQQNMASPSTPADRRKSMGPATGMTNAALVEHYSNCIKLSAENKINMKNAFNLQLIDCMSEMIRKKDPEMNNFQAASCTLDASTKIYAYRVDCVHNDTLKMAGGLGRTGGEEGQAEENGGNNAEGEAEDPAKSKKKAKKKNKKTIETNVDSLNLPKFDLEYDVDPLFKKNSAMFDEGRNGGVNFLSSLLLKDDGCQLVLDSDSLCNSDYAPLQANQYSFIPYLHGLDEAEICPTLKGFSFTTWDPDNDDLMGHLQSPSKRKLDDYQTPAMPLVNDDHAFDLDAVPDSGAADDSDNENHFGMEDVDEDEVVVDRQRHGDDQLLPVPITGNNSRELDIVELKDQLSSLPQEYSYFGATARSAWAGPLHWRFKQGPKPVADAKQDPTKKKRRKDALVLDFEHTTDFGNAFAPAKSTSKLTFNTLLQWVPEKITLPEDLHFDVKEFTQLFTRPSLSMRATKKAAPSQDLEDVLSPYDYANRRDADNFCPVVPSGDFDPADSDTDDRQDVGGMTFDDHTADFCSQGDTNKTFGQFTGDNLIAAPNMVAKIQINYARVAKKMDMKRLKTTMWNVINHQRAEEKIKGNPKPFSETYHDLPSLLPQKMADNLSVALAFAALLHLANENTLSLEQNYGNLDDFVIVHSK